MAAIDKVKFTTECEKADTHFKGSVFSELLAKIDKYNTALGVADHPATAGTKSGFVTKLKVINPQFTSHVLDSVRRSEPNLYNKMLNQASSSSATQAGIELQGVLRGLSQELKTKYATPLAYVKTCVSGKFAKPSESALFKMEVSISSRSAPLEVRGEGFPSLTFLEEVANDLKTICPLVQKLAKSKDIGPRSNWFASGSMSEVQSALVNLDQYLNHRCTRISFKVLQSGKRCDNSEVEEGLAGQVIPTVMLSGEDRPDFRTANGYLRVPEGLRIFLGPLYFSVPTNYDAMLTTVSIYRFMTLFHELTHKIIKTVDETYELVGCKGIKDTDRAVKCADSWGYFLVDYAKETNQLPGKRTSKVDALKAKFGG